jgi:cytochrome c2
MKNLGAFFLCVMLCVFGPSCQNKTEATRVGADEQQKSTLSFKREGNEVGRRTLQEMLASIPPVVIEGWDPYYQKVRRFRAFPVEPILTAVYKSDEASLRTNHWLLRALDGFAVPVAGERLLEGGAHLAFEDLEHPGSWDPIGPQKANPGPFYLIWSKPTQASIEEYPRPWQLASFDIVTFEAAFPHTDPKVAKDQPAAHGYSIFKTYCIRCHAINREGGRVGPELNVPRSIVDYRPEEQIREYIRSPLSFRYGNMPPHSFLKDQDLDGLIAYFRAMKEKPHDPDAQKNGGAP